MRADGAARLGVNLPDIDLPRLMMGGRQCQFEGDISFGARMRRETRRGGIQFKQGRSGRFALAKVERRIYVDGQRTPAVIENTD